MKITGRKFGAVLLAIGVVLVLTACGQTKKSRKTSKP